MTARVSEDWRLASAEVVGGLLEAERQRWIAALHWDARPAFDVLERARQAGQAPGLVACDADGRPQGFTHYFLHNRRLQIGGPFHIKAATQLDARHCAALGRLADQVAIDQGQHVDGLFEADSGFTASRPFDGSCWALTGCKLQRDLFAGRVRNFAAQRRAKGRNASDGALARLAPVIDEPAVERPANSRRKAILRPRQPVFHYKCCN